MVESSHGNLESSSDRSESVGVRNDHVLKSNSSSVCATLAHVPLLATNVNTFPVGFNNESWSKLVFLDQKHVLWSVVLSM